ncbi:diacylglycerol/lipid kinase family protein [Anaerorhabdus furcosa]|uniref:Lipid kinase, YegS/Rv2252/BmrU family n=1 Tax=Anaerorhabdus furcosa TaxID=118967 RepID=A0A1T4PWX6_9FIRM|nr:diacylglycerol kinase family protein [Anaerorhabdus furcosa]SJZ95448.1 lipid kinase, YegS/Rv2252/BmrU family [Anaerorhabdus furcosa]
MQHVFIVNPFTCKDKTNELIETIQFLCSTLHLDHKIIKTDYVGHATDITKQYKKDTCIYSVGGDGTAYEIANGLQKECSMAIIPAGTSNDFFRMLEVKDKDIHEIIQETIEGKTISIDYGLCNDKVFLNTTTLGLDARVNNMVCELLKKSPLPKFLLYGIAAIVNIFNPQPFEATITVDGKETKISSILIAIMNGKYYGNGFSPTKYADIQDGLFDICIVHTTPIVKMLYLLPKYFKGNTENIKEVSHLHGKDIHIKVNRPVHIQSDGENFMQRELHITLQNKALQLRIPKSAKEFTSL